MGNRMKWVSLLLTSLVLLLAACSGGGNSNTSPNTSEKNLNTEVATDDGSGIKPVTFSFYGNYDWLTTSPWGIMRRQNGFRRTVRLLLNRFNREVRPEKNSTR